MSDQAVFPLEAVLKTTSSLGNVTLGTSSGWDLQKYVPFLLGFALAFLAMLFSRIVSRHLSQDADDRRLYGLEHAVLNMPDVPPKEMWMNMGYWKDQSIFPLACRALLQQVLQHAGLLIGDYNGAVRRSTKPVNLVDIGCGCGDQSLFLTQEMLPEEGSEQNRRPIVEHYIGITINKAQAALAQERLTRKKTESDAVSSPSSSSKTQIFCADAADPTSWPPSLRQTLPHRQSSSQNWLLALDTLYHFDPSREGILFFARNELHASVMAFDLLLSESTSWWHRLFLRVICLVASTPYTNFVSRAEYSDMLVRAGYARDRIKITDVSEHVFPGIAAYMKKREEQLKPFGMGLGKLKAAGKIFGWWARTGIVRGVIVVATV